MQLVMYNCTTATFSHETGAYTVAGDTVSLKPEKNPYKMTNSCAPSSNREAPGKLIPKTYRFRSDDATLELIGDNGSSQKWSRSRE